MTEVKDKQRKGRLSPALPSVICITFSIIKFSLSLHSNVCIIIDVHITEQKLKGRQSIPNNRIESVLTQKPKSVPSVCLYEYKPSQVSRHG